MGVTAHEDLEVRRLQSGLQQSLDALRSVAATDGHEAARVLLVLDEVVTASAARLGDDPTPAAMAEAEAVIAEVVECASGLAVLAHGIGARSVPAAQRWLDALSERARLPTVGLVIPSAIEYYGSRADVVRVRAPDDGIWGLPVAVHEYGHFLATRLRVRRMAADGLPDTVQAVEDLLLREARDAARPRLYRMGHELFSDALAVLAAGPAYAWYVFRYRFRPERPQPDLHPPWARRAAVVRASLDRLAAATTDIALGKAAAAASATWVHGDPDPADGLADLAAALVEATFDNAELARIRYRSHTETAQLVARLQSGDPRPPGAPAPDPASVVNAAWLVRVGLERQAGTAAELDERLADVEARAFAALGVAA